MADDPRSIYDVDPDEVVRAITGGCDPLEAGKIETTLFTRLAIWAELRRIRINLDVMEQHHIRQVSESRR